MAGIEYQGKRVLLREDETVLDALLRNGFEVTHGCRSGVCRSCTMVATSGSVPASAQAGLREIERRQGMFLACLCRPSGDLEIREPGETGTIAAELIEVEHLSDSVVRLRLRPETPLDYEPGQYVSLVRSDGVARSYSLASLTREPWLELHIRRVPDGQLSRWAYDDARPGERVFVRGPYGSCCYGAEDLDAPIVMAGVGTGLAPLWGIVRQALAAGHRGAITLIQAAFDPAGLYLRDELRELAQAHPNLRVRTCVLRGGGGDLEQRPVDELAVEQVRETGDAAAHLAFVCGDPAIVHRIRRGLFLAGVSARRILADAFVVAAPKAA